MNFKISGIVHHYYSFVLGSLILALGVGIYSYWYGGPANVENMNAIFEASIMVDGFQKKNDIHIIKEKVDDDNVQEAIKELINFQQSLKKIDEIRHVDGKYQDLTRSLKITKKNLNNLLSFPEINTVLNVLSNKVVGFKNFVVSNNWRTLTRMSKRLLLELNSKNLNKAGFYNVKKLKVLNRNISKNILVMKNITSSSILSSHNKILILNKLKTMDTELSMLTRYLNEAKVFTVNIDDLSTKYKKWLNTISPEIARKRILLEKRSQMLLLILSGIIGFILLAGFMGFLLNKQNSKGLQKTVEKFFIEILNKNLLEKRKKEVEGFSEEFNQHFLKTYDYVQKRMSFGNYFQDALPFPAIILDTNLTMIWGNSLFFEAWELDGYQKNATPVTWDFLQRFTNLGEDDPIVMASRDKIAGIYQIQVKTKTNDQTIPYEMYVSPVEHSGVMRIMIFFYPLLCMEETISNQTRSIIVPISKTLDFIHANRFSGSDCTALEKDFHVASISTIYDKFSKLAAKIKQEKDNMQRNVDLLDDELFKKEDVINLVKEFHVDMRNSNKNITHELSRVKDAIVSVVDLRKEMEELFSGSIMVVKQILNDNKGLIENVTKSNDTFLDNDKAFNLVKNVRNELKNEKSRVDEYISQMVQNLNEMLMFEKSDSEISYKVRQVLMKTKMEIKGLDVQLRKISGAITNLDVSISKVEMLNEKKGIIDTKDSWTELGSAYNILEANVEDMNKLVKAGHQEDEVLIGTLKTLVENFRGQGKMLYKAENYTKDFKEEELTRNEKGDSSNSTMHVLEGAP